MSCKIRDRRSKLLQEQSVESQKSHHHAADKSVDMRLTGCWQKSNLCGWLMWRICIFALNSWFVATISFEFGVSLDCRSCFEGVSVFNRQGATVVLVAGWHDPNSWPCPCPCKQWIGSPCFVEYSDCQCRRMKSTLQCLSPEFWHDETPTVHAAWFR